MRGFSAQAPGLPFRQIIVSQELVDTVLADDCELSLRELEELVEVIGVADWPEGRRSAAESLRRVMLEVRRYRLLLQATVTEASPLSKLLTPFELGTALRHLRPPAFDPDSRLGGVAWRHAWRSPLSTMRKTNRGPRNRPPRQVVADNFMKLFRRDGVIALEEGTENAIVLGLRIVGPRLEIGIRIGEVVIMTFCGALSVLLPKALPETLANAAGGRLLKEVIGGPLLQDYDFRIRNVHVEPAGSVITAVTGLVPLAMPWSGLIP